MPSYDIIEAGTSAYKLVWKERGYIARLAAVPFLIKLVCAGVVLLLGWQDNFFRQALVMLPSYFADGWMVSHLVRLIFFGQRWPFRPSGDTDRDMAVLQDRALGIMRGTLMFVVIKYFVTGISAVAFGLVPMEAEVAPASPNPAMFFAVLTLFALFFWAFRLLWLYIPVAVNYHWRAFLKDLGGYSASWYLIGTWLICFVPLFFVFGKVLTAIMAGEAGASPDATAQLAMVVIHMLMDTMTAILATAGIGYGFKNYVLPER